MAEDTVPVLPDDSTDVSADDTGADLLTEETPVDDTTKTDSKESKESKEETKDESKEEPEQSNEKDESRPEESTEESEKSEETEESEESKDEAETDEVDPKEKARQEYRERQQGRRQLEEVLDSQWRTPTPQELEQEGLDPNRAEMEALRQRVEYSDWRNSVIELNSTINQESMEVFKDYPVFDESSKDFDPEFAKEVGELYKQTADLQFDETGQYVVNAKVTPYDFYSRMAKLRGASVTKGKVEGQKASEKNFAAAEPASTNKTTEVPAEEDPFLKGFDKGASDY